MCVCNVGGPTVTFQDGPGLVTSMYMHNIAKMKRYSATAKQFLEVLLRNGNTQILPGPVDLFENPMLQHAVVIKSALVLHTGEAVVVYNQINGQIERTIVHGPKTLFPKSTAEFYHVFNWHERRGMPSPGNPIVCTTSPDQMYIDVNVVRTKDDALMTVSLMLFYELCDMEKMLRETHDPIANFINAAQADVICFASKLTFEEFKQSSNKLNSLDNYPALLVVASKIGFTLSGVVHRGYTAKRLESIHIQAIETRTKMVLERQSSLQQQKLAGFKLDSERQRVRKEFELQLARRNHELTIQRERAIAATHQEQQALDFDLLQQEQRVKRELQLETMQHEHDMQVLSEQFKQESNELKQQLETQLKHVQALVATGMNVSKVMEAEAVKGESTQFTTILSAL